MSSICKVYNILDYEYDSPSANAPRKRRVGLSSKQYTVRLLHELIFRYSLSITGLVNQATSCGLFLMLICRSKCTA